MPVDYTNTMTNEFGTATELRDFMRANAASIASVIEVYYNSASGKHVLLWEST